MGINNLLAAIIIALVAVCAFFAVGHIGDGNDDSDEGDGDMDVDVTYKVEVTDGTHTVVFELNDSPTSKSFVDMLPFTAAVENYSSNEKIFDPPEPLSKQNGIERSCPKGSIAYFSPWGNIAMYYGDAPKYSGLYYMGHAIQGEDEISNLSGTLTFRLL